MTYTEEEAAERWCPYMKLSDRSRGFCAACLGSGCMKWQRERSGIRRRQYVVCGGGPDALFGARIKEDKTWK